MAWRGAVSTSSGRYSLDSNATTVFRNSPTETEFQRTSRFGRGFRLTVALDCDCSQKALRQIEVDLLVELHSLSFTESSL